MGPYRTANSAGTGHEEEARDHDARTMTHQSVLCVVLTVLGVAMLAGCGSTQPVSPNVPRPISQTQSTTPSTTSTSTSSASTATPADARPPDFVVNETTSNGDKVKTEGWLGQPVRASESDADQTALSECPSTDGRELVVKVDLVVTLESSLSGAVSLVGFGTALLNEETGRSADFLMPYSSGLQCYAGTSMDVEMGTLQPHQSRTFTSWILLEDAITPDDPNPSAETLRTQGWVMTYAGATVNGSNWVDDHVRTVTGPRVRECPAREAGAGYGLVEIVQSASCP